MSHLSCCLDSSRANVPSSHHQPRGGHVPDARPPLQAVPAGTVAILPPYLITAALPVRGLVSGATRSAVAAWHLSSMQNVYRCAHIGAVKTGCYYLGWLVPNPGSTSHQLPRDSWVVSHAGHQAGPFESRTELRVDKNLSPSHRV